MVMIFLPLDGAIPTRGGDHFNRQGGGGSWRRRGCRRMLRAHLTQGGYADDR
jgi:hypothetical protein